MPEGESTLRYQISADGIRLGQDQLTNNDGSFEISSAEDDGVLHRIRIIDIADDSVKYEYRYPPDPAVPDTWPAAPLCVRLRWL